VRLRRRVLGEGETIDLDRTVEVTAHLMGVRLLPELDGAIAIPGHRARLRRRRRRPRCDAYFGTIVTSTDTASPSRTFAAATGGSWSFSFEPSVARTVTSP